jgi:tRNA threonylcarbamoyladenosine biosynthesis protein TsaB
VRILAIETSTPASSVALGDGRRLAAMAVQVDRRGHVGFLVPAMEFCFARAGWEPGALDAVVVDVGPGLFSGIRAGLATAQGVAAVAGVPLVPATSLDVLALRAATGRRRIWPLVDVRKGEVATAPYQPVPGGVVREGPVELATPEQLRGLLESDSAEGLMVGDWEALPEGFLRGLHRMKTGRPRFPTADVLLEVTAPRVAKGDIPDADEVRPLYLREPDVRISWQNFREEAVWPGEQP